MINDKKQEVSHGNKNRGLVNRPVFLAAAVFLLIVALLAGWIAVDTA